MYNKIAMGKIKVKVNARCMAVKGNASHSYGV